MGLSLLAAPDASPAFAWYDALALAKPPRVLARQWWRGAAGVFRVLRVDGPIATSDLHGPINTNAMRSLGCWQYLGDTDRPIVVIETVGYEVLGAPRLGSGMARRLSR